MPPRCLLDCAGRAKRRRCCWPSGTYQRRCRSQSGVALRLPCSLHGSAVAQGPSTPSRGLTDTTRGSAAPRNPEGCQMVAGGRGEAATPGQPRRLSRHPGGVPENRAASLAPLRGAGPQGRRSGGLASLRPPATLFHPSGMNGAPTASLEFRKDLPHTPPQIRVKSSRLPPHSKSACPRRLDNLCHSP